MAAKVPTIMTIHDRGVSPTKRVVHVFRNGRSKAIRIPKEFEFDSDSVIMRRQPDGSILVMAAETAGLIEYLSRAEPWQGGEFLESDDDLPALDEVAFP
jgi:antitoxin VapB